MSALSESESRTLEVVPNLMLLWLPRYFCRRIPQSLSLREASGFTEIRREVSHVTQLIIKRKLPPVPFPVRLNNQLNQPESGKVVKNSNSLV